MPRHAHRSRVPGVFFMRSCRPSSAPRLAHSLREPSSTLTFWPSNPADGLRLATSLLVTPVIAATEEVRTRFDEAVACHRRTARRRARERQRIEQEVSRRDARGEPVLLKHKDIERLFQVRPGRGFKLKQHDPGWAGGDEFKELRKDGAQSTRGRVPAEERRRPRRGAGTALRRRHAFGADRAPGDGRGRQGRHHQARDVGRQSAGLPGVQLQEAVGRGARSQLPLALHEGACRSAAASASSTAPTTKTCWSSASTPRSSSTRSCRPASAARSSGTRATTTSTRFERHLARNGTLVLKFFLHLSKKEQKKRFLERLDDQDKHWKFSLADLDERGFWDDYQDAFEDALQHTSTEWAPWWVIPADHKWVTRALVASIATRAIKQLGLERPAITAEHHRQLLRARKQLANGG